MLEEYASSVTPDQPHIDTLPDEILGAIFLFNTLKPIDGEIQVYDPKSTTLSTIVVCKRWYAVVLGHAALWSRLIDYEKHTPFWIKELLQRSKSTPLDVGEPSFFKYVQLRNPRARSVLEHIFEQAPRIRTLSLQIRLAPWDYICQNFLQNPAPMLEFLNLITSCPFPDCLYPGPLFSNNAPNLRRLHIQRCLIDFSSSSLINLTELSVLDILAPGVLSSRTPDHPLKVAPTVNGWINILRDMPSLKYLNLNNAISSSEVYSSTPTIHLQNLLLLSVGARFQEGTALLHHLLVPETCGIRLRFSCNRTADGTNLFSFLGKQLVRWPKDTHERYMQAKILSGDRIHFGNSRRVGHLWDMTEAATVEEHASVSADPLLWLVLSLDSSEDTVVFFNQLLSLYSPTYSTTTTLDLWIDEEFIDNIANPSPGVRPLLDIMHSFTAVSTLNLLERSPLYLLPLLQSSSLPEHPILPSLRSLRLTRTDFEDQQRAAYFTVIAFLAWRSKILNPLVDLQIIESRISKETKESLARVGGVSVELGTLRPRPLDTFPERNDTFIQHWLPWI